MRCSRIRSVTTPAPILVKKLIENRVSFGLPSGNMLAYASCIDGSLNRSASTLRPRCDCSSENRILMKMRDEEVVSSSVMCTASKHAQLMLSEASSAPKKRAMLRSRFVSYRWMVS